MTKAIAHTYTIAQENSRQIMTALFGLCLVLVLGYAINIYRIVSHTVAFKQVQVQTASVETAVQNLDAEYATLSKQITPDVFMANGFYSGKVKIFIPRTTSLVVSMAGNEL